jgi:hypothetical protein
MTRSAGFVSLLLLTTPAFLCAQSRAAQPDVQGRVINATTGQPVPDARVTIWYLGSARVERPEDLRLTTTDRLGRFFFEAVRPGEHDVYAVRGGFVQPDAAMGSLVPITLEAGGHISGVILRLTPQGLIRGQILDADGEPPLVGGVTAWRWAFSWGYRHLELADIVNVRPDGTFVFGNLKAARYLLSASPSVGFRLGPPWPSMSSSEGLTTYYPSSLDPSSAVSINVRSGQSIDGVRMRMRRERVFTIRGRVISPASQLNQLMVTLEPEDLTSVYSTGFSSGSPDGTFEFRDVRAGTYTISTAFGLPDGTRLWGRLAVKVDGDQTDLRVTSTKQGDVTGTLRIEGGSLTPFQGSASIVLSTVLWNGGEISTQAGTDGSFGFNGRAIGRQRLHLEDLADRYFIKSIRFAGEDVTNRAFDVTPAGGSLDIVVAPGASELHGSTLDKLGHAQPGISVTIWSTEEPKDGSRAFAMATESNAEGDFRFVHLPPGSYQVAAWQGIEKAVAEYPGFYRAFAQQAKRVTLTPGSRQDLDLSIVSPEATAAQAAKVQ